MGIDIYMNWEGQTEEEKKAQYTGFSTVSGHVGYLREAYHGEPYATHVLVAEAFDDKTGDGAAILATTIRERLAETIATHIRRARKIYEEKINESSDTAKAFTAFVELAEKKEAEIGKPVVIVASY